MNKSWKMATAEPVSRYIKNNCSFFEFSVAFIRLYVNINVCGDDLVQNYPGMRATVRLK